MTYDPDRRRVLDDNSGAWIIGIIVLVAIGISVWWWAGWGGNSNVAQAPINPPATTSAATSQSTGSASGGASTTGSAPSGTPSPPSNNTPSATTRLHPR